MPRVLFVLVLVVAGWGLASPAGPAEPATAASDEPTYEGLPEGLGREAVYFTCRACHSIRQFSQQRMDRQEWDATIQRMVEKNGMAEPEPWARTLILTYLSTHFGVETEDFAGLPPGPGREEVFYTCAACHSLKLVLQQRLDRASWEETLDWMVEEQGMPELEPDEREAILGYLATALSPTMPR